ncbi:MAG: phosphoribosylamine--glycine ligase [Moorellales bacterium]
MKVLVVGGGGREHALAWKLAQSPEVTRLYCAPGNAGMDELGRCVPIKAEDVDGLVAFVRQEEIDFTVVGPEAPLVAGLADALAAAGKVVFGPTRAAAAIEGSKVWAKRLMAKYGLPTAPFEVFSDLKTARDYLAAGTGPWVIKADGLAAGKGVIVAEGRAEAERALISFMAERVFGAAGERVVIEEKLEGEEVSVLAITDGRELVVLPPAQDHKRAFDGDAGPNTGGMGAYAPCPFLTPEGAREVEEKILRPLLAALEAEGITYRGVIYAGLMLTAQGPQVLEFNCRFGDPEAQPLLLGLEGDFLGALYGAARGRLERADLRWRGGSAACVVLASEGYPGAYRTGEEIELPPELPPDTVIFHAGTARREGKLVTTGGRVMGVTARGQDLPAALEKCYRVAEAVRFAGKFYRRDIGHRALARGGNG